ncbi:DUF397 domain-containing protein [Streptomyces natalensis]|uniref:DUF397 domain-containing protein n=1 Tax=Streptomyces natalensis ATCC 27448 TaxID=1240678 RepID=A0A0D7CTB5_9ACTN|nr:DUF397 domain-containing protein [Streptomyces natalensis]KIZ19095.1 hypothetical protein SNA_04000 [Streptomyces natalensis ATCC 27448]
MSQLAWRKSSFSTAGQTECVELATDPDGNVHLRESDQPGDILTMSPGRLRALLDCVKGGRLSGCR